MAKSDLKLSGGEYALVADRITLFYERHPQGRIITELVSRTATEVTFRALVYRSAAEREPAATGWASEREGDGDVNTVACLENTETSAIGRALANLGFTAAAQRPSAEEIAKAARARARLGSGPIGGAPRPALRVAEAPPTGGPARATAGDGAHLRADVALLLARAERAGLRAARAAAVQQALADGGVARLETVERWLRDWLARRAGGAGSAAPAAPPAPAAVEAADGPTAPGDR